LPHSVHCDSPGHVRLQDAALSPLIALCATVDPFPVPLLRAARDRQITLMQPLRGTFVSRKMMRYRGPCILLPDDQPISTGPTSWPGLAYAREWSTARWIMGADADAERAEMAVDLACHYGSLLLARTTDAHSLAWLEWVKGLRRETVTFVGQQPAAKPSMLQ
jgi:hypothetical protein